MIQSDGRCNENISECGVSGVVARPIAPQSPHPIGQDLIGPQIHRLLAFSMRRGEPVRLMNGTDISPLLAQRGYRPCHTEPKYQDPQERKYGVSPKGYYLFARPNRGLPPI
jgi:hypothetical protein